MDKFLLGSHKLLYHLRELNKWQKGEFIVPIYIDLGIHNACNYRCLHCGPGFRKHKNYYLDRDSLLRLMKDMGEAGVKSVLIGGTGEPTLNKHLIEAVEAGKANGLEVALTTNGALLDNEKIAQMLPLLTWVRFTILASSEEEFYKLHRPFKKCREKVFENLQSCVDLKKQQNLKTTIGVLACVFDSNVSDLENLVLKVKRIGVDYIMIKPPSINIRNKYDISVSFDPDSLKYLEKYSDEKFNVLIRWNVFDDKQKKEYKECLGIAFIWQIDGDGRVYACGSFLEDERYSFGNINEMSFKEILKSDRVRKVMEWFQSMPKRTHCDTYCRPHTINKFLWKLKNPPAHINFI